MNPAQSLRRAPRPGCGVTLFLATAFTASLVAQTKTSTSSGTPSATEGDIYSRGFDSVVKVDGAEEAGAALTTYNAERIEVVQGAVSVFHGRTSAGGPARIPRLLPTSCPRSQRLA